MRLPSRLCGAAGEASSLHQPRGLSTLLARNHRVQDVHQVDDMQVISGLNEQLVSLRRRRTELQEEVTKVTKAAKEGGCFVGEPRPPSEGAIVARAERWRGSSRGQWPEGGESRACERTASALIGRVSVARRRACMCSTLVLRSTA